MNRKLAVVLVILSGTLINLTSRADLTSDLIAHYKFEDNVNDETGNHSGVPNGGISYASGLLGKALSLNRTGYVVLPIDTTTLLNVGDPITFSMWFKKVGPVEGAAACEMVLGANPGGGPDFDLGVQDDGTLRVGVYGQGASNSTPVDYDKWVHVVWGWQNTGSFYYINGAKQTNVPGTPLYNRETELWLGARKKSPQCFFSGLIDEMRIYTRGLSEEEVLTLYRQGLPNQVTITVTNVAPTVTPGPNQTLNEGGTAQINATFTDAGTADTHTAEIIWGDGTVDSVDPATSPITASHQYTKSGEFKVKIKVTDDDGGIGQGTVTCTVANVPHTLTVEGSTSAPEGSEVSLPVAIQDPGTEVFGATVDWGDGTTTSLNNVGTEFTPKHTYADNDTYNVTITVTDADGTAVSETVIVMVWNVSPTVEVLRDKTVKEGSTVTLSARITDPGTADTHTLKVNWGDGTTQTLIPDSNPYALSHVYADNGVYSVNVDVWDDDEMATNTVTNLEEGNWKKVWGENAMVQTNGRLEDVDDKPCKMVSTAGSHGAGIYGFKLNLPDGTPQNGPGFYWRNININTPDESAYVVYFDHDAVFHGTGRISLQWNGTEIAHAVYAKKGVLDVKIVDTGSNVSIVVDGETRISVDNQVTQDGVIALNSGWLQGHWFDDVYWQPLSTP